MIKSLLGIASALALAASAVAISTPASAFPVWVVPAIVAAGVGGLGVGAAAGANHSRTTEMVLPDAAPHSSEVMVQPGCHPSRALIRGVWRRVEVCP
jgi:hypothetical protein